ncbi:unnamed protein product [Arabidopsis lyrata]|nr:unnamed protein product [Arabidopsis lyrata]
MLPSLCMIGLVGIWLSDPLNHLSFYPPHRSWYRLIFLGDGTGLNAEEMWPVEVGMEYRVWRRKLMTPLELCLECKCCSSTTCATMPCCFGINCQLPNKPFGVCAFVPKSCHCNSCPI